MASFSKFAVAAWIGLGLLAALPTTSLAQVDPGQTKISSLDLDQVDVREALRALFKNVNVSYSIAPEVQGTITVNLKDVSFEAALQNVLKQVDATYRIEAGVYVVLRREVEAPPTPGQSDPPVAGRSNKIMRRIRVGHADPQLIAILMGKDKGQSDFGMAPEISTVLNTPGAGGGFGSGGPGGSGNNGNGNGNRNPGGNNNRGNGPGGGFNPGGGNGRGSFGG